MPDVHLFPLVEYWWLYLAFTAFVLLLLALDLGVFHRKAHAVSIREATVWSLVWVVLSLTLNYLLYLYGLWRFPNDPRLMAVPGFDPVAAARHAGLEFLAGYVVEKSLSVDNIFVFLVVFSYFGIPSRYQHRVLFYGILGALVLRGIFITIGAALIRYEFVVFLFGAFLVVTGVRMFFAPEKPIEPHKNPIIRLFRRFVPVTPDLHGQKFLVRIGHTVYATPLLISVLFLEATDIVFAVDSVPAIFSLTEEPLIVYTSNVCAILGLRAMYFMLAGAMDKFHLLKYGLAVVLVFVGLKMVWLNHIIEGGFPIGWSLAIIVGVIAVSVSLSLAFPKKAEELVHK